MPKFDNTKKIKRKRILYSFLAFLSIGSIIAAITSPIILTNKTKATIVEKVKLKVLSPIEQLTSDINNINPNAHSNPLMPINSCLSDVFTTNSNIFSPINTLSINQFIKNPNNGFITIKNSTLFFSLFNKMYNNPNINISNFENAKFAVIPILNFWSLRNSTQFMDEVKNNKNLTSIELETKLKTLLSQSKTCIVNFEILELNPNNISINNSTSKDFLLGDFNYIFNETNKDFLNNIAIGTNKISATFLSELNKQNIIYEDTYNPNNPKNNSQTFSVFLKGINKYFISIEFIPSIDNALKYMKQNSYSLKIKYSKLNNNQFQLEIDLENSKSKNVSSKIKNIQYTQNTQNKNGDSNEFYPYNT